RCVPGGRIMLMLQLLSLVDGKKTRLVEILVLDRQGLLGADPISRDDLGQREILGGRLDAVTQPVRAIEAALRQRDAGSYGRNPQKQDFAQSQTHTHYRAWQYLSVVECFSIWAD